MIAGLTLAVLIGLWAITAGSATYAMLMTAKNHIAFYGESSNGCLMFGCMHDLQQMNGIQTAFAFRVPVEEVDWRGAWFGHRFNEDLRPFVIQFQCEQTGVTFGLSLPYWFLAGVVFAWLALPLVRRNALVETQERNAT